MQGDGEATPSRPSKRQDTTDTMEPSARAKWGMNGMQRDNHKRFFYPCNAKLRDQAREILEDETFSLYNGDLSKVHFTEPDKVTALDVAFMAVANDIRLIILGDLGLYVQYRNYPLAALLEATKAILPRNGDRKTLLTRFSSRAAGLMPLLTTIAHALEGVRYKVDTLKNRPLSEEEKVTFATMGVCDNEDDDEPISDDDGGHEGEGDIDFQTMGH